MLNFLLVILAAGPVFLIRLNNVQWLGKVLVWNEKNKSRKTLLKEGT